MAAPSIVSGSAGFLAQAGSTSPNFSTSGRVAGDILCIFLSTANETIGSVPSGWTAETPTSGIGTPGAAGGLKAYFLWKVSDGTETTATIDDSGDYNIGARFVVRGVDTSNVIAAIATSTASAGTSHSCPAVSPSMAGCLIVNCVATDRDATTTTNFSSWSNGSLTGLAEVFDQGSPTNTGAAIGIAAGELASSGSSGSTSVTTASSDTAVFITVAFAPIATASEGVLSTSIGSITLSAAGEGDGTASEGALSTSIGDIGLAATGSITSIVLQPDNVDSDSYDVTTTEVIGSTIYLEGYYDGSGFGGWVNTNCRVSGGVDGATYNFVIDASGKQTAGAPAGNNNTTGYPWAPPFYAKVGGVWSGPTKTSGYSYNSTTKEISGTFVWTTGATEIRLAYKPVVTVSELDAFRTEIYTSPYAIEVPSSVAAPTLPEGVHARLTHGTGPNTVSSGTVDLWGARIGTGPLVGMVVFCEHSQEDVGDLSAMQFIRWMLGASSEAADFRSRFSTYVYVHNLSGRKCGRTRYNQDVGSDEDANRSWEDSNSEQTVVLKAAIELDIPVASVDLAFLLAYHGQQDANVNTAAFDIYTTTEFDADQEFHSRVATAVGSQVYQQDTATASLQSGTSRKFGHIARSAPLSLTLEHADAATGYPDPAAMYDTFAAATGETILSLADDGYFGRLGELSTSIGSVTLSAAGTLPVVGALSSSIGNVSLNATGALDIAGTLSASIGTIALSSAGKLAIAGTASASIGAISLTATGELALATGSGTLSQSIGEISLSAAGTLSLRGVVSASIGSIALASTSKVAIAGALSASVGAVTLSAAGVSTTSTNGTLAATLGPVTLSSAARLAIAGNVNTSIGLITLSATNVAGVTSPTPPERRAAAIGESRRAAA